MQAVGGGLSGLAAQFSKESAIKVFGRPLGRLWYPMSSVVCLSDVCDDLYCGETAHPS